MKYIREMIKQKKMKCNCTLTATCSNEVNRRNRRKRKSRSFMYFLFAAATTSAGASSMSLAFFPTPVESSPASSGFVPFQSKKQSIRKVLKHPKFEGTKIFYRISSSSDSGSRENSRKNRSRQGGDRGSRSNGSTATTPTVPAFVIPPTIATKNNIRGRTTKTNTHSNSQKNNLQTQTTSNNKNNNHNNNHNNSINLLLQQQHYNQLQLKQKNQSVQNQNIAKAQAKYNLELLRENLHNHHLHYPTSFTFQDITTVIQSIFVAAASSQKNDFQLIASTADFLNLLLSVEEYDDEDDDDDDRGEEDVKNDEHMKHKQQDFYFMSKDVLVASSFHYCDCVLAREMGIHDIIRSAMLSTTTTKAAPSSATSSLRPTATSTKEVPIVEATKINEITIEVPSATTTNNTSITKATTTPSASKSKASSKPNIEQFGLEAIQISQKLTKLKTAEIMSHAILPQTISKVTPSPESAASLRGLLLTMSEDWRALAIRLTASLYRLKNIVQYQQHSRVSHYNQLLLHGDNDNKDDDNGTSSSSSSSSFHEDDRSNTMQMIREAREALHVYAPLAQRLGMHRLKSELENTAFRILYTRQYNAATSLYIKSGSATQSVADYLKISIQDILKNDPWLASQVERLTVSARVKQPYSLWKKLMKQKKTLIMSPSTLSSTTTSNNNNELDNNQESTKVMTITQQNETGKPSLSLVQDAIALRVIVKGKSTTTTKQEKDRLSGEEFLCYYIQNRLMKIWPVIDNDRVKDYISFPKPNGYQSLHHTSSIFKFGQEWPFEVQIRTEDMHDKSEYGIAAHWDYKLQGRKDIDRGTNNNVLSSGSDDEKNCRKKLMLNGSHDEDEKAEEIMIDENDPFVTFHKEHSSSSNEDKTSMKSLKLSSMIESYVSALHTARNHMLDQTIFIFFLTSGASAIEGKLLGIPAGSSVADALIEVCNRCNLKVSKDFDSSDMTVFLNGKEADLHQVLEMGDTLMIPSLGMRGCKNII